MSQPHIMDEAESMLDVYIHDYLVKRKLNASSETFQAEAQVPPNAIAIDAPRGFLFEWWTIFWDTFIARYRRHDSVRNDPLNDSVSKQGSGNNVGQVSGSYTSLKLPPIRHHNQVSVPAREIPRAMSPLVNSGVAGSSGPVNSLPLNGWPLMMPDQLHPAVLQQQSPMQSPHHSFQHQLQQHLLLQARQTLASSSVSDLDIREVRASSNQNMNVRKDGPFKTVDLADPNNGSKNQTGRKRNQPMSSSGPGSSSRTPTTAGSSPSSGPSTPSTHTTGDIVTLPALLQTDCTSKPSYMTSIANELFCSTEARPSTPSTHTTGDIVTLPALLQTDCTSKPSYMTSIANELVHTDHNVEDGSLDDNIESLLSHADAAVDVDIGKGFTFSEIGSVVANSSDCCHLSSDGKLLATAGHDNKARIWHADSCEFKYALDEHSNAITDIRFSPTTPRLTTASLDKTVRVWDVACPSYSLRTFTGHPASVMSVDFHPNKVDLVCSSDDISEIRYWSIKNGGCVRLIKGGAKKVRFQPHLGKYLAAVVGNGVSLIDLETGQTSRHLLKGHTSNVLSVCWDISGEHLASVSEDLIRVWKIGSGGEQDCIHEISVTGKKFRCSVFHPHYPLLIIGCSQSLELWNMAENKMMTPLEEPIADVAVSEMSGLVASAGQDNIVKLWK